MKKLLLGAVMAALFMTDANGSFLQTKSSKTSVDTVLKSDMGTYYKGMVDLANALLVGWSDSLAYAAKDTEFKTEKTQLNNASKKLATIAKFTKSILNRDREKNITSNQTKAVTAAQNFQEAVNVLKTTTYWKHSGAQLRFSVVVITNALQSLAQKTVQFNVSGAAVSSEEGYINANGSTAPYNLADSSAITENTGVVGTSKVSNLLAAFKQINSTLSINAANTNTSTVAAPVTTTVTTPVTTTATAPVATPVTVTTPAAVATTTTTTTTTSSPTVRRRR